MLNYFFRRLGLMLLVLLGITVITFSVSHLVPANPVLAALGDHATDAEIKAYEIRFGLNLPLPEQYVVYLGHLLHGNLGNSIRTQRPVAQDLAHYFPATLELALTAFLISLVGIPLGFLAAVYRDRPLDYSLRTLVVLGGATPVYWLAIVALELFHQKLGLFPGPGELSFYLSPPPRVTGMMVIDALLAGNGPIFVNALQHLIVPALVLSAFSTALITRITRAAVLEVLSQDYIRTAHAKGLTRLRVLLAHAFKNSLLPVLTVLATSLGSLLSGAVLTETIFSWPGIGQYATISASSLDFNAVMGVTLLAGLAYSLVNLIADLLYVFVDPRVHYG